MSFFLILAIALGLAMDAFAVSLGISLSLSRMTRSQTLRLAFHFGVFQFMMSVVGWAAGKNILVFIQTYDHWLASGLLFAIGGKMGYGSFSRRGRMKQMSSDPTKGLSLLILSLATSLDALAVGLSLAVIRVSIAYPALIIGIVAFLMSIAGMRIGPLLGLVFGRRAEFAGGSILILIGLKILIDHL